MKNLILMMLLTGLIGNSFAQNAVKLNKDEVAPFTGVLVTEEKIKELDKAQRQNVVLRDIGLTKDQLIDYHKRDAKRQREKLSEAEFDAFLEKTGYFVLGTVLAAIAFKINDKVGDL